MKKSIAWFLGVPVTKGSGTSGNFAHRGRPKKRGGSTPGGGHGSIGIATGATPDEKIEATTQHRANMETMKQVEQTIPNTNAGKMLKKAIRRSPGGTRSDDYIRAADVADHLKGAIRDFGPRDNNLESDLSATPKFLEEAIAEIPSHWENIGFTGFGTKTTPRDLRALRNERLMDYVNRLVKREPMPWWPF